MGFLKLRDSCLHVWALNFFSTHLWELVASVLATHRVLLVYFSLVTIMTIAKVGFVTLHLPLLPLSPRNHHQTCFICLGTECAAVSTENPPACLDSYSSHSRVNTDGISFTALLSWRCLPDDSSSEQYGDGSPEHCLLDHILDSPTCHASRQRPRVKWIKTPLMAPCPLFLTNTGWQRLGSRAALGLLFALHAGDASVRF